jgi:acyl-coenzyme A thioesterase PaaI-like protein
VLRGVCVPLHIGRTTSVWQTSITDADGRMVAMVVQTQMALPVSGA